MKDLFKLLPFVHLTLLRNYVLTLLIVLLMINSQSKLNVIFVNILYLLFQCQIVVMSRRTNEAHVGAISLVDDVFQLALNIYVP